MTNTAAAYMAGLSEAQLLDHLRELADEIEKVNGHRDRLYAERRALFVEGRRREPPIGTRILGAAARVSDVFVTQTTGIRRPKKAKAAS